jgi:phospholipase C
MMRLASTLWICGTAAILGACSGGGASSFSGTRSNILPVDSPRKPESGSRSPIQHVVLIVQENRTFNNLFATFPGATGTTLGQERVNGKTKSIRLKEAALTDKTDINHSYPSFLKAYDGGNMDSFNLVRFPRNNKTEGKAPYQYVNPADIAPYWTLAETYSLANAMFTTQGSESFPAHQDLIRGGTEIDPTDSLIDNLPYTNQAWGCDSPPGSKTSIITTKLKLRNGAGPFPCTSDFPSSGDNYQTLRDLMDGQSPPVSWKYYAPALGDAGGIWSAFDVIYPVRYGPEWTTNVISPETTILTDISNGDLAAMNWVVPDSANSDHPGDGTDGGPSWVASIVNAIGESSYWNSTAIIVVWDDWGGFYDSVAPPLPRDNQGGPGFRVPMLVVSPYSTETSSSQPGYVSNVTYEFGSIVRFIEDTFDLGRLGTTDETTNSIGPESGSQGGDMLNFNQPPRQFQSIGSKYSRSHFLHEKPSRVPVDTE